MQISETFAAAISEFLKDNPELVIKLGTSDARTLAAQALAKRCPDVLDPGNPVDRLFAILAEENTNP